MNPTHDITLECWVESAHAAGTDFPPQNLPFGVFNDREGQESPRVGVAIGEQILDVSACRRGGLFDGQADVAARACAHSRLNPLMALGGAHWSALRARISEILNADHEEYAANRAAAQTCLVPMDAAEMFLPAQTGDYTDFCASLYHATNVGDMFRPDHPLLPNYQHVPIARHGRASSLVVSGTPVRRPLGQSKVDDADAPEFGPSKRLDYEVEVGIFVGKGNARGKPISIGDASDHIFGVCIVNDWSTRDVQEWEYQPLGPFLAKSFATTLSPWVVTLEALEPFRIPAFSRPDEDPAPLPYLTAEADRQLGGIDLTLEVVLTSRQMRETGMEPMRVSRGNFRDMYWTVAQMLTHHASNGCNLRSGDLLASGTVSGEGADSRGCLLELTWRGSEPLQLPSGEERKFLQDGDEVTIRGYCERDGAVRIGLGECRGTVTPAPKS